MASSIINESLSDEDVEFFIKIFVLLYADDTVVLADTPGDLQNALNAVHEYCQLWKLHLNTSKTKIVIFSRGKVRKFPVFKFGNDNIEVVDDYIYLGVTINYNGKFDKAMKKQVTQANRALFSLKTKRNKFRLPIDIYLKLFDNMIMPILLYGCEIWGHENLEMIESFYMKFLKNAIHVHSKTTNCMVHGETGTTPIKIIIQQKILIFWHRLVTGDQSKLSIILYNTQKILFSIANEYKSPWLYNIKTLLNECGLTYIWDDPNVIENHCFKKLIKLRLDDIYNQNWHAEIMRSNACLNYRIFKDINSLEFYLKNLDLKDRINLCKFRCGNSLIPVVSGRFYGVDFEDRICNLCNKREIGDEYHYVMSCTFFKNERKKFIADLYWKNPNCIKFDSLFSCKDTKKLCNLSKFVKIIMDKFK